MSISLQKYNTKSTFLRKPNEARIMPRSFLSYQVDFRTPWEGEILRKSRKKKERKKKRSEQHSGVWGVGTIPIPDSVSDASWGIGVGCGENTNPDPASDISSHSALLKNTTAA